MSDVTNVLNHHPRPDDPRLLQSEPFRAVHFVYGLFHPQPRALRGRALLGALSALGFGDEAARGMVLRLRRGGFLDSRRSGREAIYALSPRSRALIDEIARRSSEPPPAWDGAFRTLVVRVPPAARAYREQLRRHARYAGFGSPVPGLFIAPHEASTRMLEPLLAASPPGVRVSRGMLTVEVADAPVLAAAAWDLGPVAAGLRRETERMLSAAEAAEARPPQGAEALGRLWHAIGPYFELLSAEPPLPAELLAADWPLETARAAFARLALTLAGPARAYVDGLGAGHPRSVES